MMSYGEEATHFGSAAALHEKDMVYAQYREPGQCLQLPSFLVLYFHSPGVLLWRGFSLDQMVDQCFNNRHDLAHGRQMPVHYGSPEHYYQFISSPLATQMPQGESLEQLCQVHIFCFPSPWLCLWSKAGRIRKLCDCLFWRWCSTGGRCSCCNELCCYSQMPSHILLVRETEQ